MPSLRDEQHSAPLLRSRVPVGHGRARGLFAPAAEPLGFAAHARQSPPPMSLPVRHRERGGVIGALARSHPGGLRGSSSDAVPVTDGESATGAAAFAWRSAEPLVRESKRTRAFDLARVGTNQQWFAVG